MNNLRISDGTTTINLNDKTNGIVTNYVPRVVDDGDGGINETAEVTLRGNVATVRTALQNLNKLFRQAEVYQKREVGTRVFLEIQLQSGDDYWRSELLEAAPIPTSETLDLGLITGAMKLRLSWRRRAFWEGPESVVPLTNKYGTNVTTGLQIDPLDDATHDNFVSIGNIITGDLPAPIKLEVENTFNSASRMGNIWAALNVNSAPAALQHVLEGEAADYGTTPGSYVADLSGGYAGMATVPTSEAQVCYWDLDNTFQQNCGGNDFMVLMKLSGSPTYETWTRLRLNYYGLTTLVQGPLLKLNAYLSYQELGVIRIPPYKLIGASLFETIRFELRAFASSSYSMGIDFLQLMPLDSYRKIQYIGYDLGYQAKLVDNQIDNALYADWGGDAVSYQVAYGDKIMLQPGKTQKIYFFFVGSNAGTRTASVKISYRPRRTLL